MKHVGHFGVHRRGRAAIPIGRVEHPDKASQEHSYFLRHSCGVGPDQSDGECSWSNIRILSEYLK